MSSLQQKASTPAGQGFIAGAVIIGMFILFAMWGEVPTQNQQLFYTGSIAIAVVILLFGWLLYYLLLAPLPAGHKQPAIEMMDGRYRILLGRFFAVNLLLIVIAAFWDEVWHRKYGLPFGEDFLWPPHIMLYVGLILILLTCGLSGLTVLRNGRGTLQQRARTNPAATLLAVSGLFLLFALPADPIWHEIYGVDLTAWSIPHILLNFYMIAITFIVLLIYLTAIPERRWGWLWQDEGWHALSMAAAAGVFQVAATQVFTGDWDTNHPFIYDRPEWVLPIAILLATVFMSFAVLHLSRRIGAATFTILLSLLIREGMIAMLGFDEMNSYSIQIGLLIVLLSELAFAWYYSQKGRLPQLVPSVAVLSVATAVAGFPLLNKLYLFPQVEAGNLLPMLAATVAANFCLLWFVQWVAARFHEMPRQVDDAALRSPVTLQLPAVALAVILVLIVLYIQISPPPI